MKRILYISVRGDFGGGPKHLDQLISNLHSEFKLFLAAPRGLPYGDMWAVSPFVARFLEIPYRSFSLIAFVKLLRFVLQNDIDIVHSHGNGAGFYSRIIKICFPKVYVIHTFHGVADVYDSKVKKIVYRLSGNFFKFFTNWSVFVSNGERELGLEYGFSRERFNSVIYNGIEDISDIEVRSIRGKEVFKIVTLSRFDHQKNMGLAYRIAKRLNCDKRIKFVWVGDGPDFKELCLRAKREGVNNIDFIGFSENPQKYLNEADLYLSTSLFEGLPYGLIEATCFGLPIVASNVRGNIEVALDRKNALLFDSEEQAVSAILYYISSEERYQVASRLSLEVFKSRFELYRMIEELRSLYLGVK